MNLSKKEAQKKVSELLDKVVQEDPEYYYGRFVRWGKVERKLHEIIEAIGE